MVKEMGMSKTILYGAIAFLVVAVVMLLVTNSSTTIQDKSETQYIMELENAFIPTPWIVEGDSVYVDDENVFINITPHNSNQPIGNVTTKQFTGNLDLVFLFDTSQVVPTGVDINPHYVNTPRSFTCDDEFEIDTQAKHLLCYREYSYGNGTVFTDVLFNDTYETADAPTKTVSWNDRELVWDKYNGEVTLKQIDFKNQSRMYLIKDVPFVAGVPKYFRLNLKSIGFTEEYKYWFGLKPSGKPFYQAVADDQFYVLDPWTSGLNTSLTAYYDFNDTTGGLTNVHNAGVWDGTVNNAVLNTTTTKFRNAYNFDGNDDYVDLGAPLLNTATNGNFCVSAWLYPIDDTGGDYVVISQYSSGQSGRAFPMKAVGQSNGNVIYSGFIEGGTTINTVQEYAIDTWHHVVWTRTSSNFSIYVNGNLRASVTNGADIGAFTTYISPPASINSEWKGVMDEMAIYNETDCSYATIQSLYNSGNGTFYFSPPDAPTVNVTYPLNITYNTTVTQLNYTVDSADYCWYTTDGGVTNSSEVVGGINFTLTSSPSSNTWKVYCNNSIGGLGDDEVTFFVNKSVGTTLISPVNAYKTKNTFIYFDYNSTTLNTNLTNSTLSVWFSNGTSYYTNFTTLSGDQTVNRNINRTGFVEGNYLWGGETCGEGVVCSSASNRSFEVDLSPPLVANDTLVGVTANSFPKNQSWIYNATDTNGNLDSCYYNTTENSSYTVVTCNSSIITTWTSDGSKTIQYCANDTVGWETCNSTSINVVFYNYTDTATPNPASEGQTINFELIVNMTNIATTTAVIDINGTNYSNALVSNSQNATIFSKDFVVLDGFGSLTGNNISYQWYLETVGFSPETTTAKNVTIYSMEIDNCSVYTDVIFNITLKEEETATTIVPPTINDSLIEVDLDIFAIGNNSVFWEFSQIWNADPDGNVAICVPSNVLTNGVYGVNLTLEMGAEDYATEFYYLDNGTLDNTKIYDSQTNGNISIYDLLLADSTSFLFNYFDEDGLPVVDAVVHVYRQYIGNGLFREVERSKADINGDTIVHLVEEDVIYYFVISQYGDVLFTSPQYTALCQATPCTIQIEASGDSAVFGTDWDLVSGGGYTITSSPTTRLVTITYQFNASDTINLTLYKYDSDGTPTQVNTTSATGTSGSTSLYVPQSAGNVSFFTTVEKGGEFIDSEWVDFKETPQTRFGTTLSLFLAVLIILTLGLMAVSEGVGTMIYLILGVAISGFLGLMNTSLSTGTNIVVFLVLAGAILTYKLTRNRQ